MDPDQSFQPTNPPHPVDPPWTAAPQPLFQLMTSQSVPTASNLAPAMPPHHQWPPFVQFNNQLPMFSGVANPNAFFDAHRYPFPPSPSFHPQYQYRPTPKPYAPSSQAGQSQSTHEWQSSQPTQPTQTTQPTQPSTRSGNWTNQEDKYLCEAWVHVSEDLVVGSSQRREALWFRVFQRFKYLVSATVREQLGLSNRWQNIRPEVTKWSACLRRVEEECRSGSNADDKYGAARELFNQRYGHYFKFEHCWGILKNYPYWHIYSKTQEDRRTLGRCTTPPPSINVNSPAYTEGSAPSLDDSSSTPRSAMPHPIDLEDGDSPFTDASPSDLERPIGRKAAKNQRLKKRGPPSSQLNEVVDKIVAELKSMSEASRSRWDEEREMKQELAKVVIASKRMRMLKDHLALTSEVVRVEKELFSVDPSTLRNSDQINRYLDLQKEVLATREHAKELMAQAFPSSSGTSRVNNLGNSSN